MTGLTSLAFGTKFHFLKAQVKFRYLPSRLTQLAGHVRHCFNDNFSTEEKETILNILNTAKEEDLKQFGVSKKSITSLNKLQKQKGAVQTLDDLKPVLSAKVLDKMFSNMLNKSNWSSGSAIYPVLNEEQVSQFNKVLSFVVSGDSVSMCSIHQKDGILIVQSLSTIKYSFKPRMHLLAILNEIKEVVLKSPECDLCITEEVPANAMSKNTFSFQLQMGQARSMFLGFISAMPNPPKLIAVKRIAVARLFNTFIGNEKVSGQLIVEKLLSESPNLKSSPTILENFMLADPSTKEVLSNVFLLNLSYWKLTKQHT